MDDGRSAPAAWAVAQSHVEPDLNRQASAEDAVQVYRVLLGREPDGPEVIDKIQRRKLNVLVREFLSSPEFRRVVIDPLASGSPLRHMQRRIRPGHDDVMWLNGALPVSDDTALALSTAAGWRELFSALLSDRHVAALAPELGVIEVPDTPTVEKARPSAAVPPPQDVMAVLRNARPAVAPRSAAAPATRIGPRLDDGAASVRSSRRGWDAARDMPVERRASAEPELPAGTLDSPIEAAIAPYFDAARYVADHPDIARSGMAAVTHYAVTGWRERRDPTWWFDTAYYLESNPDVRDAGINPFWHYVIAGAAEGRAPRPAAPARRDALKRAVSATERCRDYQAGPELPQLDARMLVSALRARLPARGVVLAFSHDSYSTSVGGTQLLIALEQARYAQQRVAYLHLSPMRPSLALAPGDATGHALRLTLDGREVGATDADTLCRVMQALRTELPPERALVVHSLLGHQTTAVARLHQALAPADARFWLHDYTSLCEGYNLLRNDVAFCGAPPVTSMACRVCVHGKTRAAHASAMHLLFEKVPFDVIAPSEAALDVWLKGTSLPCRSASVHPHATIVPEATRLLPDAARDAPVRVAFLGHPVHHKGWPVFTELLSRLRHDPHYEFHHLAAAAALPASSGVRTTLVAVDGKTPHAMVDALARTQIDLVLMPAPWPETFSYVTYEALAAGADVATLESSGNVAAEVLRRRRGVVAQDEEALLAFFTSHDAVRYARLRRSQGIETGKLVHCGTTATFEAPAARVDALAVAA